MSDITITIAAFPSLRNSLLLSRHRFIVSYRIKSQNILQIGEQNLLKLENDLVLIQLGLADMEKSEWH